MNIPIDHKDDFFTKSANVARKAWYNPFIAWALVLGFLASYMIDRSTIGMYSSALKNCGYKLQVIEKAYNVTE